MLKKQQEREIQWLLKEKYQGKLTKAAQKDMERLKAGEPVDYVIGFVEFLGCRIDLSAKPLIPRPETEYWTQKAIQDMNRSKASKRAPKLGLVKPNLTKPSLGSRCLDMFAGSGCIGIAVLKKIPQARVDFTEKDKKLLKQIRINAKRNDIPLKRARVLQSDIFSNVTGKYDYIFANPPYIAETRRKGVQASVVKHEPREALFAGKDGLKYIRPLLKQAKQHLNERGKIYMEFDSPQKREIETLLKRYGYSSWEFQKDQYGKWRYVVIT